MKQFFNLGWKLGLATANRFKEDIILAKKEQLPILAGQKLQEVIRSKQEELSHIESFQVGFFEGFTERAEQIKGE